MRRSRIMLLPVLLAPACTTFSTVRSAEVKPGQTYSMHGSVSTPVGDEAGWFYALDCSSQCSTPVGGADIAFSHALGTQNGLGTTIGFGTSGFFPYIEAYTQRGRSKTRPFGVGARFGLPFTGWSEHRVYARVDFADPAGTTRVLWNPGVVITTGHSPNGENHGTVFGIANGFGLQVGGGRVTWTPSLSVVTAHAAHRLGREQQPSAWSTFVTGGVGVTVRH